MEEQILKRLGGTQQLPKNAKKLIKLILEQKQDAKRKNQ
jgi:hypothetical protein